MPDPAQITTVTFGGKTFRCSQRTHAHLLWTAERLAELHPGCAVRVIQGSFNDGVAASAGTHDRDAVLDVQIVGLSWWDAQRFLREHGWAAWFRFPPLFTLHLHMISLGYPGRVGIFVPGQVEDYYRHALGLKGQHDSGSDDSWFPPDIDSTIFDYPEWLEAHMPLNDADLKALRTIVREEVEKVAGELLATEQGNGNTRDNNLRRAGDTKALAKEIAREMKS